MAGQLQRYVVGSPQEPLAPAAGTERRDGLDQGLSSPTAPRRRWSVLLYCGLLALVLVASMHDRGFLFDDPFISFQYARNFAEGNGWVFNAHQAGTSAATSPLYVVILALAYKMGVGLVGASYAIFVVSLAGCASLTHATLARLGHWWAGVAAGTLVAASPWLFITRGMETTLFLLVLAACVYLWVVAADYWLGALLAALVLIRPEGVVLVVLILGSQWVRSRRPPLRTVATGGLVAVAWGIFAVSTIGSFLPGTLAAKMAQGRSGLFVSFLTGVWQMPHFYGFSSVELIVGLLAVAGLGVVAATPELRLPLGVLVAMAAVIAATYVVLRIPGSYPWYYGPFVYLAAVLAGVAVEAAATRIAGRFRVAAFALSAALVALLAALGIQTTALGPPRPGVVRAAAWIDRHTPPTATVASAEIGMLGWYTDRPIVDYLGLLSRRALGPVRHGNVTWWVNAYRPDYWMTGVYVGNIDGRLLSAPWFTSVFRRVYENRFVAVYKRIGTVPEKASAKLRASASPEGRG